MGDSEALTSARTRRDELYDAILALELALGAPTAGSPASWAVRVGVAVGDMKDALANHVEVTEGPGGLFDEIMDREPRLAHAIDRVRAEHGPLLEAVADAASRLESVGDAGAVDEIRGTLLGLIQALFQHRHRGAELVYEAYSVDVSAGD